MSKRGVRRAVSLVRRLNRGGGVREDVLGARLGGSQEGCRRVLTRAVTQGYLMRKNHKYYFIPSQSMQLPSLVVMRRRVRRGRSRRRRTRRRSAGMYLEEVMTRTRRPARRRRRARRRTAVSGAQEQQDQHAATNQSAPLKKEGQNPPSK